MDLGVGTPQDLVDIDDEDKASIGMKKLDRASLKKALHSRTDWSMTAVAYDMERREQLRGQSAS